MATHFKLDDVGLGADAANRTGATLLYERAGMRALREFVTYHKDLELQ